MKKQIRRKVIKIIGIWLGETTAESENNLDDMGADSLDRAEILLSIEDKFKIKVENELAQKWKTIDDIVDFIAKEKRPVGRPRMSDPEKKVATSVSFDKGTLEKLDEIRENETRSAFINKLVDEKYLGV